MSSLVVYNNADSRRGFLNGFGVASSRGSNPVCAVMRSSYTSFCPSASHAAVIPIVHYNVYICRAGPVFRGILPQTLRPSYFDHSQVSTEISSKHRSTMTTLVRRNITIRACWSRIANTPGPAALCTGHLRSECFFAS